MDIITPTAFDTLMIAEAATRADAEGKPLHLTFGPNWVKFKVGEGMWSPPLYSE